MITPSRQVGPRRPLAGNWYGRCTSRSVAARAKQEPGWDFGRFLRTVSYFNAPSLDDLVRTVEDVVAAPFGRQDAMQGEQDIKVLLGEGPDTRPAVLVTGATGGLGRRVASLLLQQGKRVRVLARDAAKVERMLRDAPAGPGARLELIVADLSQPATLRAELFEGVRSCVSCAAAKIRPREGTEAEIESRYYSGIKYYDSRVADDSPKAVDSRGTTALVNVLSQVAGTRNHQELLDVAKVASTWGALDDVVMGGRSESGLFASPQGGQHGGPAAVFRGYVTSAGNGGFASVRSRNFNPPLNLSGFDGLRFRVKGDGQRYKIMLRSDASWDGVGYTLSVDTKAGKWHNVDVPFSSLLPVFRARINRSSPPFDPSRVHSIQIMLSKFEYDGALNPRISLGAFELPIESISPYTSTVDAPRLVHVSSAGVTRPSRPDLAPEAATKIVQLNDALGGLLTCKLEGEDAVRESGIPFAIVRPCALTEEPPGAPVEVEQGDNIVGKMSRDDLAELCVHLLSSRAALDTTFEVKNALPIGTPWQAAAGAPPRDWEAILSGAKLQPGITGKTVGDVYAGKTPEADVARQVATDELIAGKSVFDI